MKIAAVATVLNEADIIDYSIQHLLDNGIDEIHVALGHSDDGTREILEEYPVKITDDDEPFHRQPYWVNRLIGEACEPGDFVIPFDADEFWYATDGTTIREALDALSDTVRTLHVRQFMHRDWYHRYVNYHTLGKVAFRYEPGAWVTNGNHGVNLNYQAHAGVLDIREWQFRSFEHLARKCKERVARIDPSLPLTDGIHQRRLAVLDSDQLRAEWVAMQAREVVFDPIP